VFVRASEPLGPARIGAFLQQHVPRGEDKADRVVLQCERDHRSNAIGKEQVVTVQELHERSLRQADRPIVVRDRAERPGCGLDAETRIVERPHDFEGPVSRAVVGDDEFELGVRLPKRRVKR
jgi:hypothetical protein